MAKIFHDVARAVTAGVVEPVARTLLRAGISPDAVTIVGTVGVVAGAVGFAARGELLLSLVVVAFFALTDLVDGTMARLRGYSTRFGALLDSTMDRVADGAIFGALAFYFATNDNWWSTAAALICLVTSQVISYVKARAQSLGISCDVGLAERAERLLLVGVGGLAAGLGAVVVLSIALWVLAALAIFTVGQRIVHVYRADGPDRAQRASEAAAARAAAAREPESGATGPEAAG